MAENITTLQHFSLTTKPMEKDVLQDYHKRAAAAAAKAGEFHQLVNTYSLYRVIVFVLMLVSVIVAVQLDNFTVIAIAFVVLILCFAWLVSRQSEFEKQKQYYENLNKVNENETGSITSHQ